MLTITALTKRYDTGDLALDNVTLTVPAGQVMALIGPSGAGKSTLIRCVNRLVEPTSGSIQLDGHDITRVRGKGLREARRQIGMIFQSHALVERLSVMENVLSGRLACIGFWRSYFRRFPESDIRQAFTLLERVGLDTMIDKRGDALSGGQKQRVLLARALYRQPRILVLDEGTANLDVATEELIAELVAQIPITRIIVAHRPALLRRADRVLVVENGVLTAPKELIAIDA